MFDLENLGQTLFCMTFHISGCKHDTKSILVSILTFSRSRISKMLKTNTWPWRLTLKLKVIHFSHMTLLISGCMPAINWLDLGVESNIFKVEDLRKFIFGYLTLMFDLDFQGQTTFLWIYIIFKVNHHRYIIYLWFFEFIHLDYVKFNNKIKSVTCIQQEIIEGHLKVCLTLIFKVNYGGQVTYISHIGYSKHRIQPMINKGSYVQIWHQHCVVSLSRIQPMMNKGSQKVSLTLIFKVILWGQVTNFNKCEIFGIEHNEIDT